GLNTVRIITQLNAEDKVDIIGSRLRITVNSAVDNLAAGNIAAPIDPDSGVVTGPGVYSDITKEDEEKHPVTGVPIIGFKIPFWNETLAMVKEAALLHKENRSIGWDVAITDEGPELIEGNHDWCKLLWQLPVKHGLKPVLEKYKKEYLDK
ncbi:MAG: hexapeptide transferase, partial [Flavobacteriaceae bacterium]|nr:hexapeptide transferase [Flavobacteriaceae bacterium]